jgi:hypothetical protein
MVSRHQPSNTYFRHAHSSSFKQIRLVPDLDFADKTFQERAMRQPTSGGYMLRDVILPQIRLTYDNLFKRLAPSAVSAGS